MDIHRFNTLVARLEAQSKASPGTYRTKVAALTLLGFAIMAMLFGLMGFGLVLLVGAAVFLAFKGGSALILLFKLGKLAFLLALPLWYLVKSGVKALFVRLPAPQGREIERADAPQLFEALDRMRAQMGGPRFDHVLVVDEVNAAVCQRPALGLVGWHRNYLLLGLPLLDSMPPEEALAVVAHEYGHLAGSHGRFSAFIYRLRHTWGTVQDHTDQLQGWLGKLVRPLVGWYAPYFNAYTFVLARSDEYAADAASARLVGALPAARALQRVNVVGPRHQRFLAQTFEGTRLEAQPPADLMYRWASEAAQAVPDADAQHWLASALDREGHYTDTHPTLRARLSALAGGGELVQDPPPPLQGPSAAQAWLGDLADTLRAELQSRWAEQVTASWAERHAQAQTDRARLNVLREQATRTVDEEIEQIQLALRLEPGLDMREALLAFNAANVDHALGLYIEAGARLDLGDDQGLALLDRVCALDPDATKPACQRAYGFLIEQGRKPEAQAYAERWRAQDAWERLRAEQIDHLDAKDAFDVHGLSEERVLSLKALLVGKVLQHVAQVYIARRVIPADPQAQQWVMGVRLSWWGRRLGKQAAVAKRVAALGWSLPMIVVTLDGRYATWLKKVRQLSGSRLV
jgi:Zn-dependent protease with chaperone function